MSLWDSRTSYISPKFPTLAHLLTVVQEDIKADFEQALSLV
jgi:hypothetical protein